ncbi:MAG: HAD family hydrolase [Planctomycetota bacterium]
MTSWMNAVLTLREEMQPLPTEVQPKLEALPRVRAVVFDIYGTLLISGTGDVGAADTSAGGQCIADAIHAAGVELGERELPSLESLHQAIRSVHSSMLDDTCPKPEVDIVSVWRSVFASHGIEASTRQCNQAAAEFEARMNPTWPMPGARRLLDDLQTRGKILGIVSNAQHFTLPLVEEIGGVFGVDSVFAENLCVFSYRYRQAKPAPRLFDVLSEGLERAGISPNEALYVGNDRLNDIWAASQAGLRTAWFTGDRRSLRSRENDTRVADVPHDLILTQLEQLATCFE